AIFNFAAEILFFNNYWLKGFFCYDTLTLKDQIVLLQEGWKDLFILTAVQFDFSSDLLCGLLRAAQDKVNPACDCKQFSSSGSASSEFSLNTATAKTEMSDAPKKPAFQSIDSILGT